MQKQNVCQLEFLNREKEMWTMSTRLNKCQLEFLDIEKEMWAMSTRLNNKNIGYIIFCSLVYVYPMRTKSSDDKFYWHKIK